MLFHNEWSIRKANLIVGERLRKQCEDNGVPSRGLGGDHGSK